MVYVRKKAVTEQCWWNYTQEMYLYKTCEQRNYSHQSAAREGGVRFALSPNTSPYFDCVGHTVGALSRVTKVLHSGHTGRDPVTSGYLPFTDLRPLL